MITNKISSPRRGQEEMVGFALIMIIVSIIIVVFVALTLTKPQTNEIESYEVNSFLQALLQQTSDCNDNLGFLSIQDLIFRCKSKGSCLDGRATCEVLNTTLKDITSNFWQKEEGYRLTILSGEETMIDLKQGNATTNYKGAVQEFGRGGESLQISFKAYS